MAIPPEIVPFLCVVVACTAARILAFYVRLHAAVEHESQRERERERERVN